MSDSRPRADSYKNYSRSWRCQELIERNEREQNERVSRGTVLIVERRKMAFVIVKPALASGGKEAKEEKTRNPMLIEKRVI